MPENLKQLRGRVRSIKKTKKITRAMEMVAAAKLRKTESVMKASRPFLYKMQEILGNLTASLEEDKRPIEFRKPESGYPVLIVFSSDRGLCGAFNTNVLKMAGYILTNNPEMKVVILGKKGRDYMKRYFKDRVIHEVTDMGTDVNPEVTQELYAFLRKGFDSGEYQEIHLLYSHFISTALNKPVKEQYLPLVKDAFDMPETAKTNQDYLLEPDPETVFEALVPRFLQARLYLTLAESFTSEYSSRMLAMNNATKNCDELTEKLTLRLNKARQAAITTEIVEIVSGAEALNA